MEFLIESMSRFSKLLFFSRKLTLGLREIEKLDCSFRGN